VRVGILGPLEVRDDAGTLVTVGGARLRALLIRLAIADGRAVSADRLAEDLWDGQRPVDAANAVQALVSRLRGAVGRNTVEFGPAGYRLVVDHDGVDARAFERQVGAGRRALADGRPAEAASLLAEALGQWRGPALADVADAAFAASAITRLSELRLAALEDRIDAELALGRGTELVPELQELAAEHPLRERLRGQLMRALQAAGRQADALTAYEDIRRALAEQLGVDPTPALAAVHLAILRGEPPAQLPPAGRTQAAQPALTGQEPPVASGTAGTARPAWADGARAPTARLTNLPAQLTSFVGREQELRRVGKLLGEARLVTLTGPGGAGKTRLSVEASARLAEQRPDELSDGVWFVPLAPVRDALDVPQAVLAALGIQEMAWPADPAEAARLAALPPLDRLTDALTSRRLLLVLDNCEHVAAATARLAGQVLAVASGVRILVTSREPLGVTGETLCPVPSLELPPEEADASEAARSPAVRLFADRATAVRPGFALDEVTAGPVVRICRALDGIPLAIELAAARLRALTAAQVADRLDDRFRLLSVGDRAALPRHQTLRAVVDWSWELLDEPERAVLRRLSVFGGGATPAGAEHVCALGPADGTDHRDVIDLVAALVDKSLVMATGEHQVRYQLLETVRAYAADRLAEAGEAHRARAAHAEFFLDLAERAEPELRSSDQLVWLNRMTAEHDNFSAALRHVIAAGDTASALRFVGALTWFWITRDYDAEAAEWAASVAQIAGDAPPPGLHDAWAICQLVALMSQWQEHPPSTASMKDVARRVTALTSGASHPLLMLAAPMVAVLGGDSEEARRGLRLMGEHSDPWLRAASEVFGGHLALNDGHVDEAAAGLAAGYSAFRELGDRWGVVVSLTGLANVELARAAPAEAVRLLNEARGYTSEGLASNFGEMISISLGRALALAGEFDAARAELEHGIEVAERIGERDDHANGYVELCELARREGDLGLAHQQLDRALEIVDPHAQRPDMTGMAAMAYSRAGCLAEQEGDLDEAACWHAKALALLAQGGTSLLPSNPVLATVVEGLAALAAARGDHAAAAERLGLADALHGFRDASSLELTRAETAARAALGEERLAAAYARGRALGRADALALVP
jgi:predicted ATPase/DNA-binding SARP family transcriptional activator